MESKLEAIVEIGHKPMQQRRATASGRLSLQKNTTRAISSGEIKKGDVLEASTVAAIQAVKDTPRIIPHCHPVPIEGCHVDWNLEDDFLECTVTVAAIYKTGIEMEALTGVCAGLLCAFDMVKSLEKDENGQYPNAEITEIKVIQKLKLDD